MLAQRFFVGTRSPSSISFFPEIFAPSDGSADFSPAPYMPISRTEYTEFGSSPFNFTVWSDSSFFVW